MDITPSTCHRWWRSLFFLLWSNPCLWLSTTQWQWYCFPFQSLPNSSLIAPSVNMALGSLSFVTTNSMPVYISFQFLQIRYSRAWPLHQICVVICIRTVSFIRQTILQFKRTSKWRFWMLNVRGMVCTLRSSSASTAASATRVLCFFVALSNVYWLWAFIISASIMHMWQLTANILRIAMSYWLNPNS